MRAVSFALGCGAAERAILAELFHSAGRYAV
jgi:hypothetical protein